MADLNDRINRWRDVDPAQLYLQRADLLAERAAGLKKLGEAWKPLFQSLTPDQKTRLRLVAVQAIEGFQTAMENRRMEMFDEETIELLP